MGKKVKRVTSASHVLVEFQGGQVEMRSLSHPNRAMVDLSVALMSSEDEMFSLSLLYSLAAAGGASPDEWEPADLTEFHEAWQAASRVTLGESGGSGS